MVFLALEIVAEVLRNVFRGDAGSGTANSAVSRALCFNPPLSFSEYRFRVLLRWIRRLNGFRFLADVFTERASLPAKVEFHSAKAIASLKQDQLHPERPLNEQSKQEIHLPLRLRSVLLET